MLQQEQPQQQQQVARAFEGLCWIIYAYQVLAKKKVSFDSI
jgi:hypothetical protein